MDRERTLGAPQGEPATIFLAGDVMTGRGIDRILAHPSAPELREPWAHSAETYVELAERVHGPVQRRVSADYVWGDALEELERRAPRVSIVNLETSITVSDEFWPGKSVHYRMHPANVAVLQAAGIDACVLANNHVMDFGIGGLLETLEVLRNAEIAYAGAGRDLEEASRPVRLDLGRGASLWLFGFGSVSSGIPPEWAAGPARPGVRLIDETSVASAKAIAQEMRANTQPGDLTVASIHWGSNWGHEIDPAHVAFAHALIDGGVDLVHGHSSHHVRAIEVHRGKLVIFGCGDLVNDYEGIGGHERWRGDIGAMFFVKAAADGTLLDLELVPMRMRRLQLTRARPPDAAWLEELLDERGRALGTAFHRRRDGSIALASRHEQPRMDRSGR